MKRLIIVICVMVLSSVSLYAASEEVVISWSWGNIAATLSEPEGGSAQRLTVPRPLSSWA